MQHGAAALLQARSSPLEAALRRQHQRYIVAACGRSGSNSGSVASTQQPSRLAACLQQPRAPHLQCSRSTRQQSVCSRAAPAAAATQAAPPARELDLSGDQSRAVGLLVGAMCGNVLGIQLEPEKHYRLAAMFPDGHGDMAWSFDLSPSPLPPGHVSGDYLTLVAVAASLVQQGGADALDVAGALAASYSPEQDSPQFYSPYTRLVLEGLAAGSNPFQIAHNAEGYLAMTAARGSQSASHRPERQLHGSSDYSCLLRALPVGWACRNASTQALKEAVDAAVLLTHPTETAADAAAVIAAATAWLARADPSTATPEALLAHLLTDVAVTADMRGKLLLLQDRLPALAGLGGISSWRQFYRSKAWSDVTTTATQFMTQGLAVQATQAAALALWVVCVSLRHPQQAVMLAASLGGWAGTTAGLVGGLVGALHGSAWVPHAWWQQLQDDVPPPQEAADQHEQHREADDHEGDVGGEDDGVGDNERYFSKHAVVELGLQLAALDC